MNDALKGRAIKYITVENWLFLPPTKISGYAPGGDIIEVPQILVLKR